MFVIFQSQQWQNNNIEKYKNLGIYKVFSLKKCQKPLIPNSRVDQGKFGHKKQQIKEYFEEMDRINLWLSEVSIKIY